MVQNHGLPKSSLTVALRWENTDGIAQYLIIGGIKTLEAGVILCSLALDNGRETTTVIRENISTVCMYENQIMF